MKKILVAIDFSKCAVHALKYAVNIADTINGEIQMVWVNNLKSSESVFPVAVKIKNSEIKSNFEDLIHKYAKHLKDRISYQIRTGKVHEEVCNQAKYSDVDLIIAGTHGTSGFEEFWVGSNAYRIVQHATVPVITIRAGYQFNKQIENIVLPIDSTLETRQKVPFAVSLAKIFGSKLHLLSLFSSNISEIKRKVENYTSQVEKFLDEEGLSYVQKNMPAKNITNTTIDYAKEISADLIVIMTEQEVSTVNIFLGNYARQMINHAPFPVMSLHSKEFIVSSSR